MVEAVIETEITAGQAAIWYAQHGIPVFPCVPRDKRPMTEHGFRDSTTDLGTIREWWGREPRANIGVPTGERSGWLVVDVDPRNGGDAILESWLHNYGRYPDTAEAITGGGGRHIVFRHATGLRCGPIGAGVDLKTTGGYVIAAPSIHPSGGMYRWDGLAGAKSLLTLAEAPDWLLRLAGERPKGAAESAAPGAIPRGRRNDTLASIAGSLRARGLDTGGILAALTAINARNCEPPLPDHEVLSIAQSISRYEPGQVFRPPGRTVNIESARNPAEALILLNGLPFWGEHLRWAAFRRRGNTLVGVTDAGEEARFEADKLLRFAHAQSRILTSLGVVIRTPRRGHVGETWASAAELIVRAAAVDTVDAGAPEDDLRADLARCWRASGKPAINSDGLFGLLSVLARYRREPHAEEAPQAVFLMEGESCCYLPIFREWLSTPTGGARYKTLPELREAAGLLGLAPRRFDVERDGERQQSTVWVGPGSLLKEEE